MPYKINDIIKFFVEQNEVMSGIIEEISLPVYKVKAIESKNKITYSVCYIREKHILGYSNLMENKIIKKKEFEDGLEIQYLNLQEEDEVEDYD